MLRWLYHFFNTFCAFTFYLNYSETDFLTEVVLFCPIIDQIILRSSYVLILLIQAISVLVALFPLLHSSCQV